MSNDFVSKPRVLSIYNSVINRDVLEKEAAFIERVPKDEVFKNLKKEYKLLRKEYRSLDKNADELKPVDNKKKQSLKKKLDNKKYDNVRELLDIKSNKLKMGGNVKYRLASVVHVVLSDIIDYASDATIEYKKKQVTVNFLYGENGEHLLENCESYGLINGLNIINNPDKFFKKVQKKKVKNLDESTDDVNEQSDESDESESDSSNDVAELCDRRFVTSISKLCKLKKSEKNYNVLSFGRRFKEFLSGVVCELLERIAKMSLICHKLLTAKTIQSEMLDVVLESIEVYSGCQKSVLNRVSKLNKEIYIKSAKNN